MAKKEKKVKDKNEDKVKKVAKADKASKKKDAGEVKGKKLKDKSAKKAAPAKDSKKQKSDNKADRVYADFPKVLKAGTKPDVPKYQAPSDFKPFNMVIRFKTEADGHPGGNFSVYRYEGAIAEDKPAKKVHNMADYDRTTLNAIVARVSMVLYHSSGRVSKNGVSPRLEPNTTYECHARAGANKERNLTGGISRVFKVVTKKGVVTKSELQMKDPRTAKIRKANRYFPAAFVNTLALPKIERASRRAEADDE